MFGGTDTITFLADSSFMATGGEVMMVMLRRKMVISWQTQLEPKLKVCLPIFYCQVKAGLAGCPGPDLGHFPQAAEKEGLL